MAKTPAPILVPRWVLPTASLTCLVLFGLHLGKWLTLDNIAVLLLAMVGAVWLVPLIQKIKLGDFEMELKVDALIAAQSEPEEPETDGPQPKDWMKVTTTGMPDSTVRPDLLVALTHPRYAFRTVAGLARATGLESGELRARLAALQAKGAVVAVTARDGRQLWALTTKGKDRL